MNVKLLFTTCALGASLIATAQDSATVVRDAETGKLRAPTAAELKALQAQHPQPKVLAPAVSSVRPDGTRSVNLGERGMVYAVAKRQTDGTVTRHCVKDGEAALDTGETGHEHP
jgi:hypothetical protein